MNLKLGIVFQGPLFSKGKSGSDFGSSFANVTTFDCRELLAQQVPILRHLGIPFVVSTWDSEPNFDQEIPVIRSRLPREEASKLRESSKYFQMFSFTAGVDFLLQNYPVTHIAKVRTDIQLDLVRLYEDVSKTLIEDLQPSLAVPFIDPEKPWSMQDFYFAGSARVIRVLTDQYLSLPEMHEHVHQDYFWKFAASMAQQFDSSFFPRFGRPWTMQQQIANSQLLKFYSPMSCALWNDLSWRGNRLPSWIKEIHSKRYLFLDHLEPRVSWPKSISLGTISLNLERAIFTDNARLEQFIKLGLIEEGNKLPVAFQILSNTLTRILDTKLIRRALVWLAKIRSS